MKSNGLILLLGCALTSVWGQTRYFINTVAGSNPLGDNGGATHALLWNPTDVAADSSGNFYIADSSNHRIRKVTSAGVISTIACTGTAGYMGEGGVATQAECNNPSGITVDAAGNVYFSDTGNQRVRKIGLDGKISLVAGTGSGSFSGDGGAATSATLNPTGLAVDASGNLYIADANNNRIRRITSDGNINTIAGTGAAGSTGDNGLATLAKLSGPRAVRIDSAGLVLVADTNNSRIRRFAVGGNITTVAGNKAGFSGDNGSAVSASLSKPDGVAVDSKGVIYISDTGNQRIRMVSTAGIISTVSGGSASFHGDGTAEANGLFDGPQGLAADGNGNLLVADSGNARIRVLYPSHILNTIAGSGRYLGDNGPAVAAVLTNPSFVTMDHQGNVLISDQDNHAVRKINAAGTITTMAGSGVPGSAGDGGPAASAQLSSPEGLAVDGAGNVYVADAVNATVQKITPDGTIFPVAGGGTALNDGGSALKAKLSAPHGIAIDGQGNIYIADSSNNRVRTITTDGNIHTFIGTGVAQDAGDGGPALAASVNKPWDVKVTSDGTVYIAEFSGGRVRAVSSTGIASTVGFLNGNNTGVAIDSNTDIIVAGDNQIYSLTPAGSNARIAGESLAGFAGDGGVALSALLRTPAGVVADAGGNIYICDQANNRVRKLSPDAVTKVAYVSGNQQSGPVSAVLPLPLVVQVNGQTGLPYPGVPVSYAITSGGGSLSTAQATTATNGQASVTLKMPGAAGAVTVTATAPGLPPVVFTATAVNMPTALSILKGNNQAGVVGALLPQNVSVTVLGLDKNPMAGVTVSFAVASGSAKVSPASVQTGSDGSASTAVTLGAAAGPVTVSAVVSGLPAVKFSLSATAVVTPQIFSSGVVGAGLSTPPVQAVSPNAIVSIFGTNFAPAGTSRSVTSADLVNGMVPTNLAGVCVLFGTERAPIFLVTPGQLNVQAPIMTTSGTAAVQVIGNCDTSNQIVSGTSNVAIQPATPEFFYSAGNTVAAVDGVTGTPLGPGFAAAYPGDTVTIYATGLGLTTPAFAAGQLPAAGARVSNASVSIDGAVLDPSAIQYAGVTPLNAGLYQLNIVLPASLSNGNHSIAISVSGWNSPAGQLSVLADGPAQPAPHQ